MFIILYSEYDFIIKNKCCIKRIAAVRWRSGNTKVAHRLLSEGHVVRRYGRNSIRVGLTGHKQTCRMLSGHTSASFRSAAAAAGRRYILLLCRRWRQRQQKRRRYAWSPIHDPRLLNWVVIRPGHAPPAGPHCPVAGQTAICCLRARCPRRIYLTAASTQLRRR